MVKKLLTKPLQIESAETDPSASAGDCYLYGYDSHDIFQWRAFSRPKES